MATANVELVINDEYSRRVQELVAHARVDASATSNDAYRLLQILTHTKGRLDLTS